jgi:formyl-CoA transferase
LIGIARLVLHGAYTGIRVLDLSQGIAGPYCAQILQQLGADVVKVEPIAGDWSRAMGTTRCGTSALTVAFNRGKRSLACDLRKPEGQVILAKLVEHADVVVQSFRPGVAERLEAGYEQCSARNPAVIYVSISGFGLTGPYAARPATDSVVQAIAGMADTNRAPGGAPAGARPYGADICSGVYAANAVGAALFGRARDQAGRRVRAGHRSSHSRNSALSGLRRVHHRKARNHRRCQPSGCGHLNPHSFIPSTRYGDWHPFRSS